MKETKEGKIDRKTRSNCNKPVPLHGANLKILWPQRCHQYKLGKSLLFTVTLPLYCNQWWSSVDIFISNMSLTKIYSLAGTVTCFIKSKAARFSFQLLSFTDLSTKMSVCLTKHNQCNNKKSSLIIATKQIQFCCLWTGATVMCRYLG